MALNESEQIVKAIKESKQILIAFPKNYSTDAVASAMALYLILKKQDKLVDVVCDGFNLPDNLKFLPEVKQIKSSLKNLQKFVINVDNQNGEIEDFSYNLENGQLKIFITPKSGTFTPEDVTSKNSDYKYDLIFTLDAPDLESLGAIYQKYTSFFYNTTIINIDHKPENEHFGQINITNMNSVATAGVVFRLINTIDISLLDSDVATCILTGMIAKTKSFKTPNVTPQSLQVASKLLEAGADKDSVIKNLYRSRNIGTMNLWGRALARLKSDQGSKLVWTMLSDNDFVEAKANKEDLPDIIDELISFIPGIEVVVLIYQLSGKVNVIINTLKTHNALYLASKFKPEGTKNSASFIIEGKALKESEEEVTSEIKKKLG